MYEDIRKPFILKNIPLLYIRPLPALYYYGKFTSVSQHPNADKIFEQNLNYLTEAILMMTDQISSEQGALLLNLLNRIKKSSGKNILSAVEEFTVAFSDFCTEYKISCLKFYREKKQSLINLYRDNVLPLQLLISSPYPQKKLCHLLDEFCYYNLTFAKNETDNYPEKLSASDFVILTDLKSGRIVQEIEQIHDYNKPVIVVSMYQDENDDHKKTIRHAMHLIRTGIPVIIKIITPIRLFTTIEKTYFKHHLKSATS